MTSEQDQNNRNDPLKIDGLTKLSNMLSLANRISYNRIINLKKKSIHKIVFR